MDGVDYLLFILEMSTPIDMFCFCFWIQDTIDMLDFG